MNGVLVFVEPSIKIFKGSAFTSSPVPASVFCLIPHVGDTQLPVTVGTATVKAYMV